MGLNRVFVVGAGISGLVVAYRLAQKGFRVTVFESQDVGGLASSYYIGEMRIPKTNRLVLSSDRKTQKLIKELGLWKRVFWRPLKSGIIYEREIHPLSSPLDLLRFKLINFWDRVRFATFLLRTILPLSYDLSKLEGLSVREWAVEELGQEIADKLIEPLILTKFGLSSDQISAAWFLDRLLSESRTRIRNRWGFIRGGIGQVAEKLAERIEGLGGEILPKTPVDEVVIKEGEVRGLRVRRGGEEKFVEASVVVATAPPPALCEMMPDLPKELSKMLRAIRYAPAVLGCYLIKKRKRGFVWLANLDRDSSFGGLFEIPDYLEGFSDTLGASSVVQTTTYLESEGEKLWRMSEEEIAEAQIRDIAEIFGEVEVVWRGIYKIPHSLPIFLQDLPKVPQKTEVSGLYFAGIFTTLPRSPTMGLAAESGERAAELVAQDLKPQRPTNP